MSKLALVCFVLIAGLAACSDDGGHSPWPGLMPKRSLGGSAYGRPAITTLYPNGIRFTASPTLEGLHYVVELKGPKMGAEADRYCQATGVYEVFVWGRGADDVRSMSFPLNVPCSDYRLVVAHIDRLLQSAQLRRAAKDGTAFTVERVSLNGLTYYDDGNIGDASDPSLAISALMQSLVRPYAPKDTIPDRADWYPNPGSELPIDVQKLVDPSAGRPIRSPTVTPPPPAR